MEAPDWSGLRRCRLFLVFGLVARAGGRQSGSSELLILIGVNVLNFLSQLPRNFWSDETVDEVCS
ncbi:MAG: hypothetical protein N3G20_04285, partial [Verrucomicrobiae bacterium]|nr:hypothetical protein [Verrucomicrobiae bacterium]